MKNLFSKLLFFIVILIELTFSFQSLARDLADVKASGVLRHLGVPHSNFVTQYKDGKQIVLQGLDVELIQGFAKYLGVKYQFVPVTESKALEQLIGQNVRFDNGQIVKGALEPVKGDLIANGFTILDWRRKVIDFSNDYFPSEVWLIARRDSKLKPITPLATIEQDIDAVKKLLKGQVLLGMSQSCLDPDLYQLSKSNVNIISPTQKINVNEMVPVILNNEAELTLLDMTDSLIALNKWPNQIKVIGPISLQQKMAVGFRKDSPNLRRAFNRYLHKIKQNGFYLSLVKKYYPSVLHYYPDYFSKLSMS